MALVTVCVPAYRSAGFIGHTLASILQQTMSDFQVLIALEPEGAAETIAVARDFLVDDRFSYSVNDRTLGYADNVRRALQRVETPYFAVLPHDDLWHPRYLEALLGRLVARPDASCVFADMYLFGNVSGFRRMPLVDGSLAERLLSFFLEGAEGQPWRGVTRRALVHGQPFPDSPFDGFAVECEWSLQLLLRGPVLRVAEPLYLKRQPAEGSDISVSVGWRTRLNDDRLRDALAHHRRRLLGGVAAARLSAEVHAIVELAAEAAAFRRWVLFSSGRFNPGDDDQARLRAAMTACEMENTTTTRAILGRLHCALSRHHAQRGDDTAALEHSRLAVECTPDYFEAAVQWTDMLLRTGRIPDAIVSLRRAAELLPMAVGLAQLEAVCLRRLAEAGAVEGMMHD